MRPLYIEGQTVEPVFLGPANFRSANSQYLHLKHSDSDSVSLRLKAIAPDQQQHNPARFA